MTQSPTTPNAQPAIDVREIAAEKLHYAYTRGALALEDVTFRARPGEWLAIVGPNGCGKSTLLKLLVGSLKPAKEGGGGGRVLVDGRDIAALGRIAMARRVALVPQMAGVEAGGLDGVGGGGIGFAVRETVLMARYAAHADAASGLGRLMSLGFETADDLRLANIAMWDTDVHHLAERPVETLSGGERQRVAIARAFAQETAVILLDEPTSALDPFHQLELIAKLEAMSRAQHIVIMVTHDLNFAARCASRIILMDRGRIAADGPPAEVLTPAVLEPVYRVKVHTAPALHFDRA